MTGTAASDMKSPSLKYAVMVQRRDGAGFELLAKCVDPGAANEAARWYVSVDKREVASTWRLKGSRLDKVIERYVRGPGGGAF